MDVLKGDAGHDVRREGSDGRLFPVSFCCRSMGWMRWEWMRCNARRFRASGRVTAGGRSGADADVGAAEGWEAALADAMG